MYDHCIIYICIYIYTIYIYGIYIILLISRLNFWSLATRISDSLCNAGLKPRRGATQGIPEDQMQQLHAGQGESAEPFL